MGNLSTQEFRIGNLYNDIDNQLSEMSGYEIYQMSVKENTDNLGSNEYKPIPLTEDWLIKFGFLRLGDGFEFWESSVFNIEYIGNHWHVCYISNVLCTHLKYAHELQNLYFALTGRELTLTL